MKMLASLILAFAIPSGAFAKDLLIEYRYGNQIFGSVLNIYDDGSIEHSERNCCPPHTDSISETPLDEAALMNMREWIGDATQGAVVNLRGQPTTDGSESGVLFAFSEGTRVVIHTIVRGNGQNAIDQVQKNQSGGSVRIEELVNAYVKNEMY